MEYTIAPNYVQTIQTSKSICFLNLENLRGPPEFGNATMEHHGGR
jgi:hypothetical protein